MPASPEAKVVPITDDVSRLAKAILEIEEQVGWYMLCGGNLHRDDIREIMMTSQEKINGVKDILYREFADDAP